jgi:hypothetical protein
MLLNKTFNVTNKKTGNRYKVVGYAVNATNAQDGQVMVLYQELTTNSTTHYTRELGEFLIKFDVPETLRAGLKFMLNGQYGVNQRKI